MSLVGKLVSMHKQVHDFFREEAQKELMYYYIGHVLHFYLVAFFQASWNQLFALEVQGLAKDLGGG